MLPLSLISVDLSTATTILAIAAGLFAYKDLPVFYRILFFQAFTYLVIDSYAITYHHNALSYNVEMIFEFSFLFLASSLYFKTRVRRVILSTIFLVFVLSCLYEISLNPNQLAYHTYILGGISITVIYLSILFFHFYENNDQYYRPALALTCLATVTYFACTIPYLSMMYILQNQDAESNKELFNLIIVSLGRVRYFLLAIAFFILVKPYRFNSQKRP